MAAGEGMGSMAEKWAKANIARANHNTMIGPGHKIVLSGNAAWYFDCGSYADAKTGGLTQQCKWGTQMEWQLWRRMGATTKAACRYSPKDVEDNGEGNRAGWQKH